MHNECIYPFVYLDEDVYSMLRMSTAYMYAWAVQIVAARPGLSSFDFIVRIRAEPEGEEGDI